MFKTLMLLTLIIFSNDYFSQSSVEYSQGVEARMYENKKANKNKYDGLFTASCFSMTNVKTASSAQEFDEKISSKHLQGIVSCNTGLVEGRYVSVVISEAVNTPESIKAYVADGKNTYRNFKTIYLLGPEYTTELKLSDGVRKIPQSRFDKMSDSKKEEVLSNPNHYVIVK
jgi:hypothetical protein